MPLKIVTGAMGCGKTGRIFGELIESSLREPGTRHIVIAPEQSTLQIEKRLVGLHPRGVLFNIDVLSFNRLAGRIFDECGVASPVIIDEVGKDMLLRRCVQQCESGLTVYKGSCGRPGFLKKLRIMISELLMYGVSPQDLTAAADAAGSDFLAGKLRDLSLVLTAFGSAHDELHITAEELLPRALRLLDGCTLFDGAQVVFDGFSGFTPVQYEYIEGILRRAKLVTASLTIPGDEDIAGTPRRDELFYPSKNTLMRLQKAAEHAGVKTVVERFPDEPAVPREPALVHLAKGIFRPGAKADFDLGGNGAIRVVSCLDTAQELAMVTHEIKRMVRESADGPEPLRYRDFAVVTDAVESGCHIIRDAFEKAQIPYYIDTKSGVKENPLAVFTLAALETIERSFSYDTVFRVLRSGFCDATPQELDELENYALATGVRSVGRWKKDFTVTGYRGHGNIDLKRINGIRRRAVEPLLAFKEAYDRAKSVSERCAALRELYAALRVREKLEEMSQRFSETGEVVNASVYGQIFEAVLHIVDEYEKLLGSEKIRKNEFRDVLEAGIESMRIGVLPARLDEVHIGDIRRSRRGYVKVLFFLDLNEGVVPASPAGGGILTDSDREALADGGVCPELAPTSLQNTFDEQLYIYELMASPVRHLCLAFCRLDMMCRSIAVSPVVTSVKALFKGLKEEEYMLSGLDDAETEYEALHYLADCLRDGRGRKEELMQLSATLRRRGFGQVVDLIVDAASFEYRGERLTPGMVRALYGDRLVCGVSRLETQAACAFAQFLKYGLRLGDRVTDEVTPIDRGNYFHYVFENALREICRSYPDLADIDAEQAQAAVDAAADRARSLVLADLSSVDENPKNEYLIGRWNRLSHKLVGVMLGQAEQTGSRPGSFEKKFNDVRFPLESGGELVLRGRVDRCDVRESGGERFIDVVDYKTYDKKPDINLIAAGIELQLVEYLNVMLGIERLTDPDVRPGGVSYFKAVDRKPAFGADEEIDLGSALNKEYKLARLGFDGGENSLGPEDSQAVMRGVEESIAGIGNSIMDGTADRAPYRYQDRTACDTCPFCDVCGFDERLKGFKFRNLSGWKGSEAAEEKAGAGEEESDAN